MKNAHYAVSLDDEGSLAVYGPYTDRETAEFVMHRAKSSVRVFAVAIKAMPADPREPTDVLRSRVAFALYDAWAAPKLCCATCYAPVQRETNETGSYWDCLTHGRCGVLRRHADSCICRNRPACIARAAVSA